MLAVLHDQKDSFAALQDVSNGIYPVKPVDRKEAITQTTEISGSSSDEQSSAEQPQDFPTAVNGSHSESKDRSTEEESLSSDEKTAVSILKVVESYGVNYEQSGEEWKGLSSFIPTVAAQVQKQEAIRMILPAFPFKSPNSRDKVLGVLPDLGEELALHHLNGLCKNIARVYRPGADVHISSDGLVYSGK